jgi:hypothetical protein
MEHYLSVSLNTAQGICMLLSPAGGVDIEVHAERGALRWPMSRSMARAIAAASRLADTIASPARGQSYVQLNG